MRSPHVDLFKTLENSRSPFVAVGPFTLLLALVFAVFVVAALVLVELRQSLRVTLVLVQTQLPMRAISPPMRLRDSSRCRGRS